MYSKPHDLSRFLLCSSNQQNVRPLQQRLSQSGIEADCCVYEHEARDLLSAKHYNGIAIDLLIADRDGISFAMELREEHPHLPVLVMSCNRTGAADPTAGVTDIKNSACYARLIFSLKQAETRLAGNLPHILHVEDNDQIANLIKNTLGEHSRLFRARSTPEAQIAMALRRYDLVLMRSCAIIDTRLWASENNAVVIPTDATNDPLITIINSLRQKAYVHPPAYC